MACIFWIIMANWLCVEKKYGQLITGSSNEEIKTQQTEVWEVRVLRRIERKMLGRITKILGRHIKWTTGDWMVSSGIEWNQYIEKNEWGYNK